MQDDMDSFIESMYTTTVVKSKGPDEMVKALVFVKMTALCSLVSKSECIKTVVWLIAGTLYNTPLVKLHLHYLELYIYIYMALVLM